MTVFIIWSCQGGLASCLSPVAQPSSHRGWPGAGVSSALPPPHLKPRRTASFLPLLLGLVYSPHCVCSPDTTHLKVVLYLSDLEPCQTFLEMLVDSVS